VEQALHDPPRDPEDARRDENREGEVAPEARAAQEPAEEDQEDEGEKEESDRERPSGRDRPAARACEGLANPSYERACPCHGLVEHGRTLQPDLTYSYMGI
jgi:hypothetical protein